MIQTKTIINKSVAVIVVVSLNAVGVLGLDYTAGQYSDIESTTGNTFIAGSVDFSLGASGWQATTTAVSMSPGDSTKRTVAISSQNSNPFQYFATSTNVTGDADFCTGLNVSAAHNNVEIYSGPLAGLTTATTSSTDSWEFTYTVGGNDFQNQVCDFDIDYNGWQTRHNYPTYEQGGFSDTEKVSNRLSSWGFRINKVYYDVQTPQRGQESTNEWVEIYNQTNVPLDISGWQICDNTSCDTLPTTPTIPAQKYAIIVATSTTSISTTVSNGIPSYWYLPSEVTEINIESEIGNGLANGGDRLILKRPDGVVIDEMNWGTDTRVLNPGAVDVAEGNILARVSSGYDTDSASDWVELKPPTIDLVYPDEGGSYTWYWASSHDIEWVATNNNGADEDLDISIYYVKDVNQDTVISAGDTVHVIAETTANDGLHNWVVPSGFSGYIWIYLVATGPENPMLNTVSVSGNILDPMPLFIEPEVVEVPEEVPEVVIDVPIDVPVETIDETPPDDGTASSTPPIVEIEEVVEEVTPTEPEPAPVTEEVIAPEPEPEPALEPEPAPSENIL